MPLRICLRFSTSSGAIRAGSLRYQDAFPAQPFFLVAWAYGTLNLMNFLLRCRSVEA